MALTRNVKNPKTGQFESVKISQREMKRTIMQANNWNEETYRKQYDIFKNKLRFYESVQKARGVEGYGKGEEKEHQSPQELLYKVARAKIRFGEDYEPSQEIEQIQAVTAHSITKGRGIAKRAESQAFKAAVSKIVNIRFAGFIKYYDKAAEIVATITDPIKQEEALAAFAEHVHKISPRIGKELPKPQTGVGGFAVGETYGSGDADEGDDFDFSEWITDEE